MTKVKSKYKIVKVEWEDSRQPQGNWQQISYLEDTEVCKCTSVGYLVYDDKKVIILAPNIAELSGEDLQVAGTIRIPARCVISRKVICL